MRITNFVNFEPRLLGEVTGQGINVAMHGVARIGGCSSQDALLD
jgi:hypothetical protein